MSRLAFVGLAGLLALDIAGCYREKHDDTTPARLARIEQRLDAQDKALAEMAKRTQEIEIGLLAKKIEDISAKLDSIQTMAARPTLGAAPPSTARRYAQDPALTYAVPLGNSPSLGSPRAKVTMVMAFEFACPYCRKAWDTVDALRKKYGKDLRVVYKQLVVHPTIATAAALAACAAHHQGRWRQLADLLWTKAFDVRQFDQAHIDELAIEAGLDVRHYQSDIAGACPQELKDDATMLKKFAVAATPTFFINGRHLAGARDISTFQALIDEELAKATAAIKHGVKPEKVYETEVLAKGATEITAP